MRSISDELGFSEVNLNSHSAWGVFSTCSDRLGWGAEDRREVGHMAPESKMHDLYDRAFCVTELRLRSDIIQKIQSGWVPTFTFDVPSESGPSGNDQPCDPPHAQVKTRADQCSPTQVAPNDDATEMATQSENGIPLAETEGDVDPDASPGTVSQRLGALGEIFLTDLWA